MKPFCFSILLLIFCIHSLSARFQLKVKKESSSDVPKNVIHALNNLVKSENDEKNEKKRLSGGEMDLEPPTDFSKLANLFYGKMYFLMESNLEEDLDVIAKYTNEDTQIILCEDSIKSTFAELKRFIKLLHMYFKSVKQEGFSMQPRDDAGNFQAKYSAISFDNIEIKMEWHGETVYDENHKYFIYTLLQLKGDCTKVPKELPEHPTQPKEDYIKRLKTSLTETIFNGKPHERHVYQAFNQEFLVEKTRVQICEQNGDVVKRDDFRDYLFSRYAEIDTIADIEFKTEPFSDYQTDAVITFIGTWKNGIKMKDTYRFRIEEARANEKEQGWIDWWSTWVIIECAVDLSPKTDPEGTKKIFILQVCGSIPPMIKNGPSVSSRTAFISHFMQKEEQGFHAQICENLFKPLYKFSEFEDWLNKWSGEYDEANLLESKVESYENFSFTCTVNVMKNFGVTDKEWKKRDFTMKAYFEVDRWLIKETKISCDHF